MYIDSLRSQLCLGSQQPGLRWIAIFYCLLASVWCCAVCKKAHAEDVLHGANQLIELTHKSLSHLHGTALYFRERPANDIVVEIYRQSGSQSFQETMKQPRITACVTVDDGKFSFSGLKPGKYLLFAGPRTDAGVNETYAPITLKNHWWRKGGSGLKLILQLGT